MKVIVDTHTLIWAIDDPSKLSGLAASTLQDPTNDLDLSAATTWEIAIKIGLGKLKISLPFGRWMEKAIADLDLTILAVTVAYADGQIGLPAHHKDPFDRLIIAQALSDGVAVVTADSAFDAYGITRIW